MFEKSPTSGTPESKAEIVPGPVSDRDLIILAAERIVGATPYRSGRTVSYAIQQGSERQYLLVHDEDSPYIEKMEGWNPLTSIADAFMLVDKLSERGFAFSLWETPLHSSVLNGPVAALRRGVHVINWGDHSHSFLGSCPAVYNVNGRCRAIVMACLAASEGTDSAEGDGLDGGSTPG